MDSNIIKVNILLSLGYSKKDILYFTMYNDFSLYTLDEIEVEYLENRMFESVTLPQYMEYFVLDTDYGVYYDRQLIFETYGKPQK